MLRRTQVLYRVHGHAREGLGVGVAVVQAVDETVDGADWNRGRGRGRGRSSGG